MFENIKTGKIVLLLSLFFLLFAFYIYVPGLFSIDDVTYLFMAHSLAKNHTFEIWNGFGEFKTTHFTYFGIFEPVYYKNKMYGKYPPLYPIIAYPFYSAFGMRGLFYINIISFILTIFILYKFTNLLFSNNKLSLVVVSVYSFCTFSFEYAVGLWPHMLSVFLSLLSYYFFEKSFQAKENRTKLVFLLFSGILIGISIGIRLQNIISVGIISLIILIFSKKKLSDLFSFLTGAFPIILIIGYINYGRFGSVDPFSYGYYQGKNLKFYLDYPLLLLLLASFFLFFYLIFHFREIILDRKKGLLKPVLSTLSILVLIILVADPKLILFNFLKNIYSNIFYLSYYFNIDLQKGQRVDIVYFGHIKKSLLQSSPFLILGFVSPWVMRRKSLESRKIFLLTSAFFLQLMFISSFFFHGGFAFNVRYGLELLPFGVILFCYMIKDIEIEKSQIVSAVILFILVAAQNILFSNQTLWKQLSILYFPLILSFMLISLFIINTISKSNAVKYLFGMVVLLSVIYGMAMVFTEDLLGSRKIRKEHQIEAEELGKKIKNDSFIIMEVNKIVAISAVKTEKKVRIARKGRNDDELINFYLKKYIPVYVISNKEDSALIEKGYAGYSIKIIPSENFILYEILGLKTT